MFGSIGLTAEYVGGVAPADAHWAEMVSFIGLGGNGLRGSLVVSIPGSLLQRCHPTRSADVDDQADWLAEIANLTLGRIKSRLHALHVTIELSTPITISAKELRFARFASTPIIHKYTLDESNLYVGFQAVSDDSAALDAALGEAPVAVGEAVFF